MNFFTLKSDKNDKKDSYLLMGLSNFVFFAILIVSELVYRNRLRNEVKFGDLED